MRGARRALLGLAALALLALVASRLSVEAVTAIWARSDARLAAAALALMTSGLVFLAGRWRALLPERARVATLPLTGCLVIGNLLTATLPGPVGELAAAAVAGRRFGVPAESLLAASLHARVVGLGVAAAMAAALWAACDLPVPAELRPWVALTTIGVTAIVAALVALSARPALLERVSAVTVGRIPPLFRVHASVVRLAGALRSVARLGPGPYLRSAAWALAGHVCIIAGIGVAAAGIGAAPGPAGLAFSYAISTAGGVMLVALPGSQLGWDAMFTLMLVATSGVTLPDAVAITLLIRVQQLLVSVLGAAALLAEAHGERDEPAPPNR